MKQDLYDAWQNDIRRKVMAFFGRGRVGDLLLAETDHHLFYDLLVERHYDRNQLYLTRGHRNLTNLEVCEWYADRHAKGVTTHA